MTCEPPSNTSRNCRRTHKPMYASQIKENTHVEMQHTQHRVRLSHTRISHDDLNKSGAPIAEKPFLTSLKERLTLDRLHS